MPLPVLSDLWRRRELSERNPQLLTIVHGVDLRGRPVIRAYTGNTRHPVYQEYQDVIVKHYQKAARLSAYSRHAESPYRANNTSASNYCTCTSSNPSSRSHHVSPHRTPTLSCARSPAIVPELKGMRAMVSRLRSSLAIHSGLGTTKGEDDFLPVIPVRSRQPTVVDCPKKGFPKVKSTTNRRNFEVDLKKEGHNASNLKHQTPVNKTDRFKGCKETSSKVKKKKRKKTKALHTGKVKPDLKPIKDIGPFRPISSKYLIT